METGSTRARLLDEEDAAWFFNKTPRWVRDKWQKRELPAVKIGRSVRFRLEDLEAYVADHTVPPVR
jgi:excisionase family DNA binding protein